MGDLILSAAKLKEVKPQPLKFNVPPFILSQPVSPETTTAPTPPYSLLSRTLIWLLSRDRDGI